MVTTTSRKLFGGTPAPAGLVGAGFLFCLLYAAMLGLNFESSVTTQHELEKLSNIEADAAAFTGHLSNSVFFDERVVENQSLTADEFVRSREARIAAFKKAVAAVDRLESFAGRAPQDSLRWRLDGIGTASDRRESLVAVINQPGAGLLADFTRARAAADEVFTVVSEQVALPTADYLAAKNAEDEFLVSFAEADARDARQALAAFVARAGTFPGLSDAQRRALAQAGDRVWVSFGRLVAARLEIQELRGQLRRQLVDLMPALDRLAADARTASLKLRRAATVRDRDQQIASALVASMGALLFGVFAVAAYRRLQTHEGQLREIGDRFHDFARASSDALWEIDGFGRLQAMFGDLPLMTAGHEDLLGADLTTWAGRFGMNADRTRELIARPTSFRDLEHVITRGGERRWLATSGLPVFTDTGAFCGFRLSSRDVTAARQQAEAQEIAEQRLSAIVEHLPLALFRVEGTPDKARYTFVSPSAESIIGYSREALLSRPLQGDHWFVIPEDRERFKRELQTGLESNGFATTRGRVRLADGTLRWVQQITRRAPAYEGRPPAVEGLWLDVTSQEMQLRQLTDFARAIDAAEEAIYIVDSPRKEIVYYNRGYARIFGLTDWPARRTIKLGEQGTAVGVTTADVSRMMDEGVRAPGGWKGEFSYELESGRVIHFMGSAQALEENRRVVVLSDITARVNQEREMAAVRAAVDHASDGIVIFERVGGPITYANAAVHRILALPPGTRLEGNYLVNFLPDRDKNNAVRTHLIEQFRAKGAFDLQIDGTRADGSPAVVQMRGAGLPDDRILMMMADVTAEVAASRASDRRERVMRSLGTDKDIPNLDVAGASARIAAAAADALAVPLVSIWLLSEGAEDMMSTVVYNAVTGQVRAGATFRIADHPTYVAHIGARRPVIAARVEDHQEIASFIDIHLKPSGIRSVINFPIVRDNRTIGVLSCEDTQERSSWLAEDVQFCAHLADFTALTFETIIRRKTVQELGIANRRLSQVVHALDSAQDHILIQDSEKKLTYANRRFLDLIGADKLQDVLGRRPLELLLNSVQELPTLYNSLNETLDREAPWRGEVRVLSPTLGVRDLEARVSALADGGVIYAATDITHRKLREAQEATLRKRLADAQRLEAIGSLAGGVAHDFNNIIGATRGYADLLVQDLPEGSETLRFAERIVATCRRAAALVEEIMAFSRLRDANRTTLAVATLLSETEDFLLSRRDKEIRLQIVDLAPASHIEANANQILQVLANLIVNAADASQGKSIVVVKADVVQPSPDLRAEFSGAEALPADDRGLLVATHGSLSTLRYVRLAVTDHGSGISATVLPRIFEPFFTTKEKTRGTGLGLAVVAGIVEAHRGAIRVETAPGSGSTFEVYLPLFEGDAAEVTSRSADPGRRDSLRGNERILIIDDEADIAEALAIGLERLGYETAPVFDPLEAADLFNEDAAAWDVVISDQSMPKMKGTELIAGMRARNPQLKAIICTGYSETASAPELQDQVDAMFTKPVTADVLAAAIRKLFPILSV